MVSNHNEVNSVGLMVHFLLDYMVRAGLSGRSFQYWKGSEKIVRFFDYKLNDINMFFKS